MASFFNLVLDTIGPGSPSVQINGEALYTSSTSVTLTIGTTDEQTTGYQMKVWGIEGVASEGDASWQTFQNSFAVNLTTGDGLKTVYVKLRDDVGNESATVNDTITLDTAVPVVTITGPDKTKISKIATFDTSIFNFTCDVDFIEYKVCVVPATASLEGAGTIIATTAGSKNTSGTQEEETPFEADTNIEVTIKGADLETASSGDGTKIIKVFVKSISGIWSQA